MACPPHSQYVLSPVQTRTQHPIETEAVATRWIANKRNCNNNLDRDYYYHFYFIVGITFYCVETKERKRKENSYLVLMQNVEVEWRDARMRARDARKQQQVQIATMNTAEMTTSSQQPAAAHDTQWRWQRWQQQNTRHSCAQFCAPQRNEEETNAATDKRSLSP